MNDTDAMSQDVRDSNGQFIPGDDDGVIGVVFPWAVKIIGNSVSVLDGVSKEEHEDIPHGL